MRRKEEAAVWGASAARGCSIEGGRKLFLGGSPAAWVCWNRERDMRLLGDLPLRGAARLETKGRGCFWGIGAPAARGCSIEGGRKLFLGGSPAARVCWIRERDMRLLGDLPLRGAARLETKGRGCFWGIGAPAARGCSIEGGRKLFLGGSPAARGCWIRERDMPLRGAARLETKGRGCFWGSCRCAGLLD